jgi:hypothetical protein
MTAARLRHHAHRLHASTLHDAGHRLHCAEYADASILYSLMPALIYYFDILRRGFIAPAQPAQLTARFAASAPLDISSSVTQCP